jgi:hypothetical protein
MLAVQAWVTHRLYQLPPRPSDMTWDAGVSPILLLDGAGGTTDHMIVELAVCLCAVVVRYLHPALRPWLPSLRCPRRRRIPRRRCAADCAHLVERERRHRCGDEGAATPMTVLALGWCFGSLGLMC